MQPPQTSDYIISLRETLYVISLNVAANPLVRLTLFMPQLIYDIGELKQNNLSKVAQLHQRCLYET